jgi:hypothetical protein
MDIKRRVLRPPPKQCFLRSEISRSQPLRHAVCGQRRDRVCRPIGGGNPSAGRINVGALTEVQMVPDSPSWLPLVHLTSRGNRAAFGTSKVAGMVISDF